MSGLSLLESALSLSERGFAVLALQPGGKKPLFDGGYKKATRDTEVIARWWSFWPNANVGAATGAASGFFALDVDPRHGGDETLAELERKWGALPITLTSLTGGGGRHLLFRHVAGIRNSAEKRLGPGLDVRGEGGHIVAPPSIHPNGRPYRWIAKDAPIASAPPWLVELARTPPAGSHAAPPESWRRLVADGVAEGQRNDALTRLAGHLLRKCVDPWVVLEIARCWNATHCRPPLDDNEVICTVDSVARCELRRRGARP
jgi:hypothetical protein